MTIEPEVPLTWGAQLAHAERVIAGAGSLAPRDEAVELLASLLGAPGALLLARPASPVSLVDAATYAAWVARRAAGEATPHITGRLTFMGLEFAVGRDSPLPDPGAWRLVEMALQVARHCQPEALSAAQIGAGCGAVALALAAFEPRFTRIYAVDASTAALETAAANGARYLLNLVISWLEGDGIESAPEPVDLIIWGQAGQAGHGGSAVRAASATSARRPSDAPAETEGTEEMNKTEETGLPPAFTRLVAQTRTKLRPGGALISALPSGLEPAAMEALTLALPTASVWVAPPASGVFIAVALKSP